MPDTAPVTYTDAKIDEDSREVYMLALKELKGMLTAGDSWRTERADTLANICNAVACGFSPEDKDEI